MSARTSLTRPLVKSALFVCVTVLATALLALSISGRDTGSADTYRARFTDTTGLIEGDSVRIAGVEVGRVTGIRVVDRRFAEVSFSVAEDRAVPASATASIKYLNMVGQRYIDLRQGTGPVGATLPAGALIPLDRTTPALDLTQLFNGFQPLFQGLSPQDTNALAASLVQVLQGEGGTVTQLVRTVGSLTTTLATKDQVIGRIVENLNTVLKTVNDREEDFTELVTTLEGLVSGFADDREPIGEAVEGMSELAVSTADLLQEGRAPLRTDIRELGRLSDTLADNTPLVENFLEKTPEKMRALTRLTSYGSWLNLYLCGVELRGVTADGGGEAPTGLPVTEARCTA
ncbi:MCE family protein [Streptomyces sp. TRM 70351]|uniref:MCE family protein n=1 Tax=Streptomyces sp. TRM 70351 TaxID=3116552 RepID=UPI002E7C1CD7|nr:MCE family protein [Streptomyces sp. TRM 70351]MEE1927046.1 MCE family protein [Streptomyces sp. TRM 70351]